MAGCATTTVESPDVPPTEAEIRQAKEKESYDFACLMVSDLLEYDACVGFDSPIVVWSQLVAAIRAYGAHVPGEAYVHVDPLSPHPWQTVIHEMTHYILWNNGLTDRCRSEELARYVAGQTRDWRVQYGCGKEL